MLRRRFVVALAIPLLAVTASLAARSRATEVEGRLVFQGQEHGYLLHVPPSYTGTRAVPLVIVLHGAPSNARKVENESGFSAKADGEGFLVVYPEGSPMRGRGDGFGWNSGGMGPLVPPADDVAYLRALVQELARKHRIDRKRVYAAGMSNGGMMAHRLGAEAPDLVAAIAPVAGPMNVACPPGLPVPVIAFHGGQDQVVPLHGRTWGPFSMASVPGSMRSWAKRDGCTRKPERTDSGGVVKERYPSGKNGSEVVLYIVKDGEHAWPHRGPKDKSGIDATDVIWEFFVRHPKR